MEIEKDFYNKVEDPNYLKHILYGDSVAGSHNLVYRVKEGPNYQYYCKPLSYVWDTYSTKNPVVYRSDNEYIFEPPIEILNYDIKSDSYSYIVPKYLMRHYYKGKINKIILEDKREIYATRNHSFVDVSDKTFIKCKIEDIQYVPTVCNRQSLSYVFNTNKGPDFTYKESDLMVNNLAEDRVGCLVHLNHILSKYGSIQDGVCRVVGNSEFIDQIYLMASFWHRSVTRKNSFTIEFDMRIPEKYPGLDCINKTKISKIEDIDYSDYVYDLEVPDYHVFIIDGCIVHNTDSIFINIPGEYKDIYEKIRSMNKVLKDVNELIVDYTKNTLMPRCNIDPKYCETSFKGELLIESILFLDVKKSYAYKQLAAEAEIDENNNVIGGIILKKPEVMRRSTLGIKGDTIPLSKDIMEELIEYIAFDNTLTKKEKYTKAIEALGKYNQIFLKAVEELDAKKIGAPVRWQKKDYVIHGMKLFNALIDPVFQHLSFGYALYCKFNSLKALESLNLTDVPLEKVKMMVFPEKFDVELTKKKMQEYGISIDINEQRDRIISKVCKRIIAILKED